MENKNSHFDDLARSWDSPETIARNEAFAAAIKKHLTAPVAKLMDFGCGTGLLTSHFLHQAQEIVGIETSQGMQEVFNKRFKEQEHVSMLITNLEEASLPAHSAPFEVIMTAMAFHHLKNPREVLLTFKQHLSPGGRVFIIDLDTEDGSFHPDNAAMGVHHYGFSRQELSSWAQELGFNFEHQLIYQIQKNERSYGLFMGIFTLS